MKIKYYILVGLISFLGACKKNNDKPTENARDQDSNPYVAPKWHSIGSGLPNNTNNAVLNLIALSDSCLSSYCYSMGMYNTINKGISWNQTANNSVIGGRILSYTSSGDTIYAGNEVRGVFMSINKGSSWSMISNGFPAGISNYVTGIYSIKKVGPYIFIATTSGVFRASLNGTNMVSVNNGLPLTVGTQGYPKLYVSNIENIQNYIYITTAAGIYKSTDYGNTWTLSNSGMPAVIYDSFYGNYSNIGSKLIYGSFFYLYVATRGAGVYYSSDLGVSWQSMNSGLSNLDILYMTNIGDYYYVINSQYEIYVCNTLNISPTWSKMTSDGLPAGLITSICSSRNKLFVATPISVYTFE